MLIVNKYDMQILYVEMWKRIDSHINKNRNNVEIRKNIERYKK